MDWHFLRTELQSFDFTLFSLAGTPVTLYSVLKLLLSLMLLVWLARRGAHLTERRLLARSHFDAGTRTAIGSIVRYAVLVIGTVVVLQTAGINLTAFAVVGSALGVGVGFGLQNIISNFISGLIIMLERPIKVGDRIELAGAEGVVRDIGARRTTVMTVDGIAVLVPNQRFITDNVTNLLHFGDAVRLRLPFSVPASVPLAEVEKLVLPAVRARPEVHADPAPEIAIATLGGNTGYELRVWYDARAHSKLQLQQALNGTVAQALAGGGVALA